MLLLLLATDTTKQIREFQLRHRTDSEIGQKQTELRARLKAEADQTQNGEGKEDDTEGPGKQKKKNTKNAGLTWTKEEQELMDHKVGKDPSMNMSLKLNHGDLLIMGGKLQEYWRHRVPMLPKDAVGPRICFTFRSVSDLT